MPLEIGYVPAAAPLTGHGLDVPSGLPSSTTDLLVAAPKTVSVLYAALVIEERHEDVDLVLAAHAAGVEAAILDLNRRASAALVYRWERRYTPEKRLAEMLEAEPYAEPERREELAAQARAELRDPTVVERIESTGLRINQLFHIGHNENNGDPHLHTHLFLDAEVTAADDGRDYPRHASALYDASGPVMQSYDVGMATALYELVHGRFFVSEETGRRELSAISDEAVAGFPGTACIPDVRFHQLYAHRALRRDAIPPIGRSSGLL